MGRSAGRYLAYSHAPPAIASSTFSSAPQVNSREARSRLGVVCAAIAFAIIVSAVVGCIVSHAIDAPSCVGNVSNICLFPDEVPRAMRRSCREPRCKIMKSDLRFCSAMPRCPSGCVDHVCARPGRWDSDSLMQMRWDAGRAILGVACKSLQESGQPAAASARRSVLGPSWCLIGVCFGASLGVVRRL